MLGAQANGSKIFLPTEVLVVIPKDGDRSGWWQFKYFLIFTPKMGEMIQFDEHIFEMGWFNHQLVISYPFIPPSQHH